MKIAPGVVVLAVAALIGGTCAWQAFAQPDGLGAAPPPALSAGPQGQAMPGGEAPGWRGVSLAQFQARMRRRLMQADTNGDGRISRAEWMSWRTTHPGHGDPAQAFARLDTNGDGFITPDEIDARAARRFARMDVNHDGLLTPDERAASHGDDHDDGEAPVQPLGPQ